MHFNYSFAWCNNLSCLKKSLCNLFTEKYFLFILQRLRKNATETQGSAAACHTSFIWCVCWLQTDLNYVNSCSPCSHCLYLSSRKQVSGADLVRDAPHPIRQGWGDCGWVPIQTMHPPLHTFTVSARRINVFSCLGDWKSSLCFIFILLTQWLHTYSHDRFTFLI